MMVVNSLEKYTLVEKNNSLEIRNVALVKKVAKTVAIATVCFSLLSLAFAAGYIGTFLLFK